MIKRKTIELLDSLNDKIKEWAGDQLTNYLAANPNEENAKLATKDHRDERIEVCKGCEYFTTVKIKAFLPAVIGCGKCTCALITKARMIEHFRIPSMKEGPMTEEEIKLIKKGEPSERITTECPHENGNLWLPVDLKYN